MAIMKLIVKKALKILFILGFLVSPWTLFADSPKTDPLSLDFDRQPLKKVLKEIERQTEFTFVFNTQQIDVDQECTIHVENRDLLEVLNTLFSDSEIAYRIEKNHIVLIRGQSDQVRQQEPVRVSGIVTDEAGQPLIGVNIVIKGTTEGTITDVNGEYEIWVEPGSTLVFSYVGYLEQEVRITGERTLDVTMSMDTQQMEEVVVVGYGRESKALLSSSVGTVSSDKLTDNPEYSITSALQGRSAGIQVVQNSGAPGKGITVRVRGVSSIRAGAEPLYVIDGVPLVTEDLGVVGFSGQDINTVSDINPNEIESISILKDASATAIYGARGSNGVVLITTKRGRRGVSKISLRSSYGWQRVVKKMEMLNAREFMEYRNEASLNDGGVPIYSQEEIENNTIDTDWQDHIFRTAPIQNYNLSITGGSDKTNYFASLAYFDQEGIVLGTDYRKFNGRLNLDHQLNERFKMGSSFGITRSINNRKEGDQSLNGPVPNALSQPPIYPVYNEDGTFNDDGPFANPVSIATYHKNEGITFRTLGNIYGELEIIQGLSFQSKLGIDYIDYREHTYDPSITRQGGKYKGLGLESNSEVMQTMFTNTLNYRFNLQERHLFDMVLGNSYEDYSRVRDYIRGQDFPSPELEYIYSASTIIFAEVTSLERKLNSYFGRLKYNFDNKYLLTLTARYDGSSRFGENNRYGFFPSGDLAWRVTEEPFFNPSFINDLKLRFSYGMTGNDQVPDFSTLALYSTATTYNGQPGTAPTQLPNPDLKWESTSQINLGVDVQLLDNRISLTTDLYYKKTTDLLLDRPIPMSSGFSGITTNIGSMENRGLEVYLQTVNLDGAFRWATSINLSMNRNEVTELYNNQPIEDIGRGYNRVEVGEPIGVFYGWKSLGVDPTTGDLVFADIDDNGIIDENDRTIIGNPHPDAFGGFNTSWQYAGIELSVFFQFSYGNDIFNGSRRYLEVLKGIDNQTKDILRRWQEEGDITDMPRATNSDPNANDRQSSRFIEDGSYLKMKNIKLSYNFPSKIISPLKISRLSAYVIGENLLTLTDYSGMDPEVNYAGQDVLRMGTDFFTYPQAKAIHVGLNVEF